MNFIKKKREILNNIVLNSSYTVSQEISFSNISRDILFHVPFKNDIHDDIKNIQGSFSRKSDAYTTSYSNTLYKSDENEPRFDNAIITSSGGVSNSDGLIFEGEITSYSNIAVSAGSESNCSIVETNVLDPFGNTTAIGVAGDTDNKAYILYNFRPSILSINNTFTFSVYTAAGASDYFIPYLLLRDSSYGSLYEYSSTINLSTSEYDNTTEGNKTYDSGNVTFQGEDADGKRWYRVDITATIPNDADIDFTKSYLALGLSSDGNFSSSFADNTTVQTYFHGVYNCVEGDTATSFINQVGTVTRDSEHGQVYRGPMWQVPNTTVDQIKKWEWEFDGDKYTWNGDELYTKNGNIIHENKVFGVPLLLKNPIIFHTDFTSGVKDLRSGTYSFNRGSSATYIKNGILYTAEVDEPRITDNGLLLEPGSTNYVPSHDASVGWNTGSVNYIDSGVDSSYGIRFHKFESKFNLSHIAGYFSFSSTSTDCVARVTLRAGTIDSSAIAYYKSAYATLSGATKVSGPGILTNDGTFARITGLSANEDTVVEIRTSALTSGEEWTLRIYLSATLDTVDIGDYIMVTHVQAEAGLVPTSLIPTNGSPVSRATEAGTSTNGLRWLFSNLDPRILESLQSGGEGTLLVKMIPQVTSIPNHSGIITARDDSFSSLLYRRSSNPGDYTSYSSAGIATSVVTDLNADEILYTAVRWKSGENHYTRHFDSNVSLIDSIVIDQNDFVKHYRDNILIIGYDLQVPEIISSIMFIPRELSDRDIYYAMKKDM